MPKKENSYLMIDRSSKHKCISFSGFKLNSISADPLMTNMTASVYGHHEGGKYFQ